ncbi:MAG: hypothetical protein R3D52_01760 [Xanthobacteraceae bacterium]
MAGVTRRLDQDPSSDRFRREQPAAIGALFTASIRALEQLRYIYEFIDNFSHSASALRRCEMPA